MPRDITSSVCINQEQLCSILTKSLQDERARLPCRQLNSQAIKSSVLCYISPIVAGKCSIVSAKCVCKVTEEGFQTAWTNVCKTRELCDEAIVGRYLSIVHFRCSLDS